MRKDAIREIGHMRLIKVLGFLISLMSGFSAASWAQPVVTAPGPGKHFFFLSTGSGFPPLPPGIIPPVMMGLQAAHLSADQQKQVNQIVQSNHSQTAPLIDQLESVHKQIADKLLAPGAVSAGDLALLENRAAQLDAQIQQQALNASLQVRALLTPDQVARMAQFHQKMAALQAQMKSLMSEAQPPEPEANP
jgi:ferredoxin-NADP reductase